MTTCEHVAENGKPNVGMNTFGVSISSTDTPVVSSCSRSRNSFKLPVTLWVYGKKVQVEALVDSGATTSFINKSVVESNNLVTNKLAHPYDVYNADGTSNKQGQIKYGVRSYVEIGSHKSTHQLLVADLGDKDMILGYTYLRKHNPEIDWERGEWRYTRCPESCAPRARKNINVTEEETDELQLPREDPLITSLDELGEECIENPHINWISTEDPEDLQIAQLTAEILAKDLEEVEDDDHQDHRDHQDQTQIRNRKELQEMRQEMRRKDKGKARSRTLRSSTETETKPGPSSINCSCCSRHGPTTSLMITRRWRRPYPSWKGTI